MWSTTCNGVFEISETELTSQKSVTIFSFNMTSIFVGKISESDQNIIEGRDANLKQEMQLQSCFHSLQISVTGPVVLYDLKTSRRIIKDSVQDLCSEMEKVEEMEEVKQSKSPADYFKNFVANIKPTLPFVKPVDEEKATLFMQSVQNMEKYQNIFQAKLNLFEQTDMMFQHFGNLDKNGKFHGYTILKIFPEKVCIKGHCKDSEFGTIKGNFNHGLLDGIAILTSYDNFQMTFIPLKGGIVHGMVVSYGAKTLYEFPKRDDFAKEDYYKRGMNFAGIARLVKFVNGNLINENVLQGMYGNPINTQGYLYGPMDTNGKITGKNVAYIYPGAEIVLLGEFKGYKMKFAKKSVISKAYCKDSSLRLEFDQPSGPTFFSDFGNISSAGKLNLLPDPLENMNVELKTSSIPKSGLGLFAKRSLEPNELVSMYNGYQTYGNKEYKKHSLHCKNITQGRVENEIEEKCFKNLLRSYFGTVLDLPPWLDDLKVYNATLGHKVNHDFGSKINAHFGAIEHPRFGQIPVIFAKMSIYKGEEIFLDYGFDLSHDLKKLAPWFIEGLEKHEKAVKMLDHDTTVSP